MSPKNYKCHPIYPMFNMKYIVPLFVMFGNSLLNVSEKTINRIEISDVKN